MRRKLFNVLADISLALFLGVVVVGIRSYSVGDAFWYRNAIEPKKVRVQIDQIGLQWSRGGIYLYLTRWTATSPPQVQWLLLAMKSSGFGHELLEKGYNVYPSSGPNALGRTAQRLGFGANHETEASGSIGPNSPSCNSDDVTLPCWFLALLFALLPALRLRRWRIERQRNRPGFCRQCGYDLRATPLRCPECGMVVDPSRVAGSE